MDTNTSIDISKYKFTVREGISIVNFYTDWSFYSKIQKLILKKLGQDQDLKFKIFNVNCDRNKALTEKFEINYFPTVLIFKNGSIVNQFNGLQDICTLESMLKKIA